MRKKSFLIAFSIMLVLISSSYAMFLKQEERSLAPTSDKIVEIPTEEIKCNTYKSSLTGFQDAINDEISRLNQKQLQSQSLVQAIADNEKKNALDYIKSSKDDIVGSSEKSQSLLQLRDENTLTQAQAEPQLQAEPLVQAQPQASGLDNLGKFLNLNVGPPTISNSISTTDSNVKASADKDSSSSAKSTIASTTNANAEGEKNSVAVSNVVGTSESNNTANSVDNSKTVNVVDNKNTGVADSKGSENSAAVANVKTDSNAVTQSNSNNNSTSLGGTQMTTNADTKSTALDNSISSGNSVTNEKVLTDTNASTNSTSAGTTTVTTAANSNSEATNQSKSESVAESKNTGNTITTSSDSSNSLGTGVINSQGNSTTIATNGGNAIGTAAANSTVNTETVATNSSNSKGENTGGSVANSVSQSTGTAAAYVSPFPATTQVPAQIVPAEAAPAPPVTLTASAPAQDIKAQIEKQCQDLGKTQPILTQEAPVTAPTAPAEAPVTAPTATAEAPVTAPSVPVEAPMAAPTVPVETPVTAPTTTPVQPTETPAAPVSIPQPLQPLEPITPSEPIKPESVVSTGEAPKEEEESMVKDYEDECERDYELERSRRRKEREARRKLRKPKKKYFYDDKYFTDCEDMYMKPYESEKELYYPRDRVMKSTPVEDYDCVNDRQIKQEFDDNIKAMNIENDPLFSKERMERDNIKEYDVRKGDQSVDQECLNRCKDENLGSLIASEVQDLLRNKMLVKCRCKLGETDWFIFDVKHEVSVPMESNVAQNILKSADLIVGDLKPSEKESSALPVSTPLPAATASEQGDIEDDMDKDEEDTIDDSQLDSDEDQDEDDNVGIISEGVVADKMNAMKRGLNEKKSHDISDCFNDFIENKFKKLHKRLNKLKQKNRKYIKNVHKRQQQRQAKKAEESMDKSCEKAPESPEVSLSSAKEKCDSSVPLQAKKNLKEVNPEDVYFQNRDAMDEADFNNRMRSRMEEKENCENNRFKDRFENPNRYSNRDAAKPIASTNNNNLKATSSKFIDDEVGRIKDQNKNYLGKISSMLTGSETKIDSE